MNEKETTKNKENLNKNKLDNPELYMAEAGISVSLTSFMTVVVFFFIGLLLTGSPELQIRLRVPLVFLFLSAFGFLYSALIYANASGEVSRLRKHLFHKQMSLGNIISEYWGVYCLVFATPIIVLGYSPDKILSIIVLIVSVMGFFLYHYLGYSILERYLKKTHFYCAITSLFGLYVLSFYTFYIEKIQIYYIFSFILLISIMGLFTISLRKKEE